MPYAPTNVAASYVSDAALRVTWTPPSGDYDGIEIERGTDGAWADNEPVAVLGTGYTAFVDRTVSANRRYRYRARSYGDGGYSSWQYSGYVYTTPAAPTGGRLAVITFHSLEDRIVKSAFQQAAQGCTCPKDFPVCVCGKKPKVRLTPRKPILPDEKEIAENPRARSAKLRVCEKIGTVSGERTEA